MKISAQMRDWSLTLRVNAPARMFSPWPTRSLKDILTGVFTLKVSESARVLSVHFLVKLPFTRVSHTVVVYVPSHNLLLDLQGVGR